MNKQRAAKLSTKLHAMRLFWLSVALMAVPLHGFSQQKEQKEAFELDQVVVTGTKTEEILSKVPVRTEVLTLDDFKAKGAINLYEALDGVPGIRVEEQCSYCNFSMVRMQGLDGGQVQILIDGQPIFGGVMGVYGLHQIPASMIDRIEVVKGPGSALYGPSAIAGVINIITRKPTKEPTVEASAEIGEYGTASYNLFASYALKNMDMVVYAQRDEADEIYEGEKADGSHMLDRVWSRNNVLGTRVNFYELLGDDSLTLAGRVYREDRKGGEQETFTNPFAPGSEGIGTDRYELQLGYSKSLFGNDDLLSLTLASLRHYRDASNDTFLGDYMDTHDGMEPPLSELRPYNAKEQQYTMDINYLYPIWRIHKLLAGFQYSYNKLDESGKYVVMDPDAADYGAPYQSTSEKHAHDFGFYAQDEIALLDNLTWLVGARYDIHNSRDSFAGSGDTYGKSTAITMEKSSLNPRTSLMYKPVEDLTLRTSVGTGFRVPYGFSEDLHLCSGSPRVYKPGNLDPEQSIGYTLSADYDGEWFFPYASIFRTDLKDKIGLADASADAKLLGYDYEWENIGDAYTQGAETGIEFLFAKILKLGGSFTYTDAQYQEERSDWSTYHPEFASVSKYIPRTPEYTAGLFANLMIGNWEINLNANWTGKMYIDYYEDDDIANPDSEIVHTPSFWVVNTKVAKHKFLSDNITIFAGVKNLFDEVQEDKRPDDAAFMYAPYYGRIIYAGMSIAM